MKRGLFIAFEGVEGVGKSTQASLLAERVRAELQREVVLTREPGGTALAEKLRQIVLSGADGPIDDRTEALIMAAARASHVSQLIFPSLKDGRFVICDRFAGSYLAYQGFGRGLELDVLKIVTHFSSYAIDPDMTFLLQLDPAAAMARKGTSRDRIEIETDEFFARVAKGYEELSFSDSWVTLDASLSVEQLHEEIFAHVLRVIQNFGEK
ncbi:MAG: dTMP kinase [Acidimicrobiaceae bacterium]|nr:dTMP kinase [Acidimicrobiaceae bacterium]